MVTPVKGEPLTLEPKNLNVEALKQSFLSCCKPYAFTHTFSNFIQLLENGAQIGNFTTILSELEDTDPKTKDGLFTFVKGLCSQNLYISDSNKTLVLQTLFTAKETILHSVSEKCLIENLTYAELTILLKFLTPYQKDRLLSSVFPNSYFFQLYFDTTLSREDLKTRLSELISKYDISSEKFNNKTFLHALVQNNDKEILTFILLQVPDFIENSEKNNKNKSTCLHVALLNNKSEIPELLIEHISEEHLTKVDEQGNTPLHLALLSKNSKIARWIEAKVKYTLLEIQNNTKNTPLHIALENGDLELARELIKRMAPSIPWTTSDKSSLFQNKIKDIFALRNQDDFTALHLASFCKDEEIIHLLINHMHPMSLSFQATTVLLKLAQTNFIESLKKFLAKAQPSVLDTTDRDRNTALHIAIQYAMIANAKILIDKMTPNQLALQNREGDTALHIAFDKGQFELAKLLFEKMKPESLSLQNGMRETILHKLAKHSLSINYYNLVTQFFTQIKSEVFILQDEHLETPLHIACKFGKIEIVKLLVEKMPNESLMLKNYKFKMALELALEKMQEDTKHQEVADFLLNKITIRNIDLSLRTHVNILKFVLPNWDWNKILQNPSEILTSIYINPPSLFSFINAGAQNVNPLELCMVYANHLLYQAIAKAYSNQIEEYKIKIMKNFPLQFTAVFYKTKFTIPETPKPSLPDISEFSLQDAITIFQKLFAEINFSDPSKPNLIPSHLIVDQDIPCTAKQLQMYAELFCKVMLNPKESKYQEEKDNPTCYDKVQTKFRYAMYGMQEKHKILESSEDVKENTKIKITIDRLLLQFASSGNHCFLPKKRICNECINVYFGGTEIPSLENQVAKFLHNYRMGIIEKVFTTGTFILSHQMASFIKKHPEIGIQNEDLSEEDAFDPFTMGKAIENEEKKLQDFHDQNTSPIILSLLNQEIQRTSSEISQNNIFTWLEQTPPKNWNGYDDLIADIERKDSEEARLYLQNNFSIFPSFQEVLDLSDPSEHKKILQIKEETKLKITVEKKKIEEKIKKTNEEFQSLKKQLAEEEKYLRQQNRSDVESMRTLEKIKTEIQNKSLEILKLSQGNYFDLDKLTVEAYMEYSKKQNITWNSKKYLHFLKEKQNFSQIIEEMKDKPVEEQWIILQSHLDITDADFSRPPLEHIEKMRGKQNALFSFTKNGLREDRLISLLVHLEQFSEIQ